MKVISPTHLVLCRQSFLSLSGVEAEARGYDANQTHGFRSSFSMDGIVALGNGIVHGHAIMVQRVDNDNIIIGVAQPARGVRSSYWVIGDLYYYLLHLEEPTWSSRYGWELGKISQMTRSAATVTELSEKRPYTGSPGCVSGAVALAALRQYIPPLRNFRRAVAFKGIGEISPLIFRR